MCLLTNQPAQEPRRGLHDLTTNRCTVLPHLTAFLYIPIGCKEHFHALPKCLGLDLNLNGTF